MENNSKPVRKRDLVWREVDGEVVIISPEGKSMKILNDVASRIWTLLDGEHDAAAIASILSKEYDEQEESIKQDSLECIHNLRQMNLLD